MGEFNLNCILNVYILYLKVHFKRRVLAYPFYQVHIYLFKSLQQSAACPSTRNRWPLLPILLALPTMERTHVVAISDLHLITERRSASATKWTFSTRNDPGRPLNWPPMLPKVQPLPESWAAPINEQRPSRLAEGVEEASHQGIPHQALRRFVLHRASQKAPCVKKSSAP